ncbi:hypothetical protein BDN72DRAFT_622018 [Pluteus cervinus]|uniref:Uncharacterized protein n=1 Tax=Pluteus cervinus TaxID=181527 RepID=A0ACD3AUL0_9AGAR|nr:hypothetical protein BDN72DRAFT_622018 [Pluteus cervinus]
MIAPSPDLPSGIEESLAACPQFRILVVGTTGVGKSSLIGSVFNLSLDAIDIAHNRAGRANISFGYICEENPRFILHDSQGFEHGGANTWGLVEQFLRQRNASPDVQDHVHAIWLCIETPRTGSRLQHTGDENLIALARELEIPLIVVFTKFDVLVVERVRKLKLSPDHALAKAEEALRTRLADEHFPQAGVEWVRISTKHGHFRTLKELTDVTRQSLHDVEGALWVPWALAQQINARQKVEQSIKEGCKRYWLNLSKSTLFEGEVLRDCLWRIYEDIIKIWNFYDPQKLLYKKKTFALTLKLVEDFMPKTEAELAGDSDFLSQYSDVMTLATAIGATFAQALGAVGIGIMAAKYLSRKYQALPQTARFLGAYIIDLTLVLHNVFLTTLFRDPPRRLSEDIIEAGLTAYDSAPVHRRVYELGEISNMFNFEQHIAELIQESIPS